MLAHKLLNAIVILQVSNTSERSKMGTIKESPIVFLDKEEKQAFDEEEISCLSGPTNQVSDLLKLTVVYIEVRFDISPYILTCGTVEVHL